VPARRRALHVLNPFFAGLGGEEAGDLPPRVEDGARGPGRLLETLAPEIEVVATLVTGDNLGAQHPERAVAEALRAVDAWTSAHPGRRPELVLAGPAFRAGRYGMACGVLCRALGEHLGVPAVASMHPENPGAEAFRREVAIARAGADVMDMHGSAERLVRAGLARLRGESLDPAVHETLPQGRRRNAFAAESGAERAVAMLLRKLGGEPIATEYAMPVFERVAPAPPVGDPRAATIALVTSGGIVPRGNPDRIESASASRFGEYSLEGLDSLTPATHETAHGGYDPTFANADPNRVLPLDAARDLERAGAIGRLHARYYATVGNGTAVERARRFGREIAARLVRDGVQAVILTST
jgi:glycine reductase